MVVHPQVAEFVEEYIVDALCWYAYQSDVQGDATLWRAAAPLSTHLPD